MTKLFIYLALIAHFLGDFYFQSDALAESKNKSLKKTLVHGLIHFILMGAILFFTFGISVVGFVLLITAVHILVDYLKTRTSRWTKENLHQITFLWLDQLIHILFIIILAKFFFFKYSGLEPLGFWTIISAVLGIEFKDLSAWALAIIIIMKPSLIMVKRSLMGFIPPSENEEGEEEINQGKENAGALIGVLERLLIVIFLALGQYGAVGFVLTAKSIVRYNKLAQEPAFSEYYLIGTLLSTLVAVLVSIIVL